jgi:trehalose/maltose hydrolase-like predicted phosphorylase
MFPWQSGNEGTEETQRIHLNPLSGRWEPDLSRNQRHVNAPSSTTSGNTSKPPGPGVPARLRRRDDAGDRPFLVLDGALQPGRERYEIHGVMGSDEFHERYPGSAASGLRNNAYTNVLVAWLCGVAARVLTLLPASRAEALRSSLGIDDAELHRWDDMSRRMFVPFAHLTGHAHDRAGAVPDAVRSA